MRFGALLLLSLALSGCASNSPHNPQAWIGHPFSEVQKSRGLPVQTRLESNGNTLYGYIAIHKHENDFPTTQYTTFVGPNNTKIGVPGPAPMRYDHYVAIVCTTWFEVDKNDVVLHTFISGNSC